MHGESDDAPGDDPGMPRWVKVLGGLALLVVAAVVVLHLTGFSPGGHGP